MHHAMDVMGSRIPGFSQKLFDDTSSMPADEAAEMWAPWIRSPDGHTELLPHYAFHHSRLSMIQWLGPIAGYAFADHGWHPVVWLPSGKA